MSALGLTLLLLGATQATTNLPADVAAFAEDHASCEHWRGEDGYDADRAREIAAAINSVCPGIDRRRARLLARHRNHRAARAALEAFEDIE